MRPAHSPPPRRGAAAIELALLTLPLTGLTVGMTEFGRALHQYNTLAKTVRDAVRHQTGVPAADTLAGRCLALTGSKANNGSSCSGTPVVPGLALSQVTVCDRLSCPSTHSLQPTGRGVVNLVTVTINGAPFTSMAPFVMPSITFGPISATMAQPV